MFRRNILIILILAILIIFSSCGGEENTTIENKVLFAHNSTGIAKYIYENGKLVEIKTLDPVTLNESIIASDKLEHKYIYDKKGILSGLLYEGQNMRIEYDENSFPKRAGGKNVYFLFTCNDYGVIVKEEIYKNKKLVLENRYTDDGTPISSNYIDLGLIEYNFSDNTSYVSVTADDETLYYEITIEDDGKLSMFSQYSDYATVTTAWEYGDNGLVSVAAIETTNGNGSIREQYELLYNENNLTENIFRLFIDQYNNLKLNSETYYTYNENGKVSTVSTTDYNDDSTVKSMSIVKYDNDRKANVLLSTFEDNVISLYEESQYSYDDNGNTLTVSKAVFTGDDVFASGEEHQYKYNSDEKLTGIEIDYLDENKAVKNKKVERYNYDDNGFCITAWMYLLDGESRLIEKKSESYTRDDSGNITSQTTSRYDYTDTLTGTTVVENLYNVKGKLLTSVTRNYDAHGNEIIEE